jgi:hypothetical protein
MTGKSGVLVAAPGAAQKAALAAALTGIWTAAVGSVHIGRAPKGAAPAGSASWLYVTVDIAPGNASYEAAADWQAMLIATRFTATAHAAGLPTPLGMSIATHYTSGPIGSGSGARFPPQLIASLTAPHGNAQQVARALRGRLQSNARADAIANASLMVGSTPGPAIAVTIRSTDPAATARAIQAAAPALFSHAQAWLVLIDDANGNPAAAFGGDSALRQGVGT